MSIFRMSIVVYTTSNKKSAKLTEKGGSYVFSCGPFTILVRHLLPTSDINTYCDFKQQQRFKYFLYLYILIFIDLNEQQV